MNAGTIVQAKYQPTSIVGPSLRAGASSVMLLTSPKITSFTCTGMFVRLNIDTHCPAVPPICSANPTVNGVVITNRPTRNTDAYARRVVNDAVSIASVVEYSANAAPAARNRGASSQCFCRYSTGSGSPAERPRKRTICGSHTATSITDRNAAHREIT